MQLYNNREKTFEFISLLLCDCRQLLLDIDAYARLCAVKGTKATSVKPFDTNILPSVTVPQEIAEQERRAKMTPEEIAKEDLEAFLNGKQVRR